METKNHITFILYI